MSLTAHGAIESWPVLSPQLRGIAHELAGCHNKETGVCCPGKGYLASRCGISDRHVVRMVAELEKIGVVRRVARFVEGRQTSNSFEFLSYRGDTDVPLGDDTHVAPEGDTGVIQNQEKESGKRNKGVSATNFRLPHDVDPKVWQDFEAHRREIGKKLTDRARNLNAKILAGRPRPEQQQIVDATIRGGWTGLFAPKDKAKVRRHTGGIPDFDDPRRKAGTVL